MNHHGRPFIIPFDEWPEFIDFIAMTDIVKYIIFAVQHTVKNVISTFHGLNSTKYIL